MHFKANFEIVSTSQLRRPYTTGTVLNNEQKITAITTIQTLFRNMYDRPSKLSPKKDRTEFND